MKIEFIDVLITVIFLLVLALPGFIFAKLKLLPEKTAEAISTIVLYCCQSALLISSFQERAFDPAIGLNIVWVMLLSVIVHMCMFLILKLVFIRKSTETKIRVVKYAGVFANCGFMGFPFLQSLFRGNAALSEIMIYGAALIAVFNVLNWTFGVYIITGDRKLVSPKKILLNPVIISVVIGLLMFFLLPAPLERLAADGTLADKILTKLAASVNYIAAMVTPASMIVVGIRLANVNVKQLFMDKWSYVSAAFKLVVMPLIAILVVAFLPVAGTVKYTVFFLLSMPSATGTAMFAVKFGGDSDFASVCVLLSTLLSVITIPLLFLVINGIFGISMV
ncbi:MAG: AEC family transporter [Clostridia bacterium]|nr:AEC family transporter [Clostridia bacterium]